MSTPHTAPQAPNVVVTPAGAHETAPALPVRSPNHTAANASGTTNQDAVSPATGASTATTTTPTAAAVKKCG